MALVPCARCRQPFYASCHDGACHDAVCPYCEYDEMPLMRAPDAGDAPALAASHTEQARERAGHGRQHEPTLRKR